MNGVELNTAHIDSSFKEIGGEEKEGRALGL